MCVSVFVSECVFSIMFYVVITSVVHIRLFFFFFSFFVFNLFPIQKSYEERKSMMFALIS